MTANITYRLGTAGTPPVSTTFKNLPLNNTEIDGNFKSILNDIDLKAPIDSPTFTTAAAAPTPAAYDSSTKIATTAYVQGATIPLANVAAAGKFDLGGVTPSGTTRLNYGGVFWPTSINLSGTATSNNSASTYYYSDGSGVVTPKSIANVRTEIVTKTTVEGLNITSVGTLTSGTWNASTIGVLYGGTGQSTLQAAMNSLAGATTAAKYLRGDGTNVTMSSIAPGDVPTLNQDTSGTATNAVNLNGTGTAKTAATAGYGYGFWNSAPITYGVMMALSTDTTNGGRIVGETTSDYNMYFTMNGGTNRGFVFRSAYGSNLLSVNPTGIYTGLAVTAASFNSITGLGGAPVALAASATAGTATTVSRSDHVHPFPTAANIGLGNVTNESKATMFTSPAFTGTTTGITSAMVGLGSVTNESKATMFTSPAFTGTATAVNLTVTGNLTVSGTTTSLNTTTLDVADLNITVGSGAINATQANGAGLTIGNYASNPTLLYGSVGNDFTFNRAVLATSFNSITGFDATAVTEVTSTAATTGSSNSAARRDHKHTIAVLNGTTSGIVTAQGSGTTTVYLNGNGAWSTPPDNNTWNANALNVAGYVAAPSGATANLVWKTDASGNPAWRADADTVYTHPTYTYSAPTADAVTTLASIPLISTLTQTNGHVTGGTMRKLVAGTNVTITPAADGNITISSSYVDTNTWPPAVSNGVAGSAPAGTGSTSAWLNANGAWSTPTAAQVGAIATGGQAGSVSSLSGHNISELSNDSAYITSAGTCTNLSGGSVAATTITASNTANATSTSTGAIKSSGGIAAANDIWAGGNITAYSDARIKTNIVRITSALAKIEQLNGYTFDRTDINTPRQTGVIAQEVLKVLPEAVLGSEEGTYGVAYGNMVGLLIEAIKELRAEVAELRGTK